MILNLVGPGLPIGVSNASDPSGAATGAGTSGALKDQGAQLVAFNRDHIYLVGDPTLR